MSTLKIFLFGGMRVLRDDSPNEINLTSVSKSLLAFLVINRHRSFHRELLMEMFWSDADEARASNCLSSALWRLKTAIEPEGVAKGSYLLVEHQGHEIRFNPDSDFWLDTLEFEKQARSLERQSQDMQPISLEAIEAALMLYSIGFLNGIYDDWALREHERYHDLYINLLNYLTTYHSKNRDFAKGVHYGRLLLEKDPLREDIHRTLMSLYVDSGQRTLAIRQYHHCKKLLKTELQVDPDEKTRALFAEITSYEQPRGQGWAAKEAAPKAADIREMVDLFQKTHKSIEDLQTLVQLMASRFDQYLKGSE